MLDKNFIHKGFTFVEANQYVDENNSPSLHDLKKLFDLELEEDYGCPFRKRAYLKFKWDRKSKEIIFPQNQGYFQTSNSNSVDGGKVRQFKVMDRKVFNLEIVQSMVYKDLAMIESYLFLNEQPILTIGMHFIRYTVNQACASFSSPDWLHKDDEPLVFVHLIELSRNALGGDNLIADENKKVTHVIRLENPLDTLILNKNVYHAVTPLGSRQGVSIRDVVLLTIEPNYTQMIFAGKDKVA